VPFDDRHVVAYLPTLPEGRPVAARLRSGRTAIAYRGWRRDLGPL
jgi:hypothetical protein